MNFITVHKIIWTSLTNNTKNCIKRVSIYNKAKWMLNKILTK
jgi:hypothetical protein